MVCTAAEHYGRETDGQQPGTALPDAVSVAGIEVEEEASQESDDSCEVVTLRMPDVRPSREPVEEAERAEAPKEAPLAADSEPEEEALSPTEEAAAAAVDIDQLAYRIWQQRGCPEDADRECWFEAEGRLLQGRVDDLMGDPESVGLGGVEDREEAA